MDKTVKKGIIHVFSANIISLFLSLVTSFVLPKNLSIEAYSMIKSFQLYINYAGLMHLGYVDGMYLKYGGKNYNDIEVSEFKKDIFTIRIFQLVVLMFWLIIGILVKDYIIIAFALAILPQNMNSYFRYLYQSIGEFKKYSKILNITSVGSFIANIVLLFLADKNNGFIFCIGYVIIYTITWIILEFSTYKKIGNVYSLKYFSYEHLKSNIKIGMFLMLGTFSSIILTSIDRWFVKFFLETKDFAEYSFAVTMDNFINVAVTPITITLYNYFCRIKDKCNYERIRNNIMFFSVFIISAVFPAKFILEIYLKNYISSLNVMLLLFASQLFFVLVKGVYVNLYKVKKQQKKYFIKLIEVIIFGIIANIVCFYIVHKKESFAFGTLLSAVFWYFISINDFKELKVTFKEILYPIFIVSLFLFSGVYFQSIIGWIVYLFGSIVITLFFYKDDIINLKKTLITKKIKN